ncbi:MAG: NUDIX domain-containing protein [Pseudomonadota bacterium]
MTLGVRAWVERDDGCVALVRHTYTPGLYFPGGGVERGEPAAEALRREMHEEIGAVIFAPPILLGVFSNHPVFPNDHVLFYRVPPETWEQQVATSDGEIAEVLWVKPESPPGETTPATARRFLEFVEGRAPSPFW